MHVKTHRRDPTPTPTSHPPPLFWTESNSGVDLPGTVRVFLLPSEALLVQLPVVVAGFDDAGVVVNTDF